jgi:hypothetical protein
MPGECPEMAASLEILVCLLLKIHPMGLTNRTGCIQHPCGRTEETHKNLNLDSWCPGDIRTPTYTIRHSWPLHRDFQWMCSGVLEPIWVIFCRAAAKYTFFSLLCIPFPIGARDFRRMWTGVTGQQIHTSPFRRYIRPWSVFAVLHAH